MVSAKRYQELALESVQRLTATVEQSLVVGLGQAGRSERAAARARPERAVRGRRVRAIGVSWKA
jgi:hypothetical protein